MDNVPHPNWQEFPSPGKDTMDLNEGINEPLQLESETDNKLITSKIDHNSKSARELLHNLSEILNNISQTDQQRSEGQHLLNSLAELFSDGSNTRSSNLDDSGHSSFINENSDREKNHFDMLDLSHQISLDVKSKNITTNNPLSQRKKSELGNTGSNRLSLSLNSALPLKVTQPNLIKGPNFTRISLDSSKNGSCSSNSSVKSDNRSVLARSAQNNLKVKAARDVLRKGPLKAMIPVKDLKKSG